MGIIRVFLAMVVMYGHLRMHVLKDHPLNTNVLFGMNAGFAVMYFYIISGFLISYVINLKYKTNYLSFYRSRFVKIFSLYWPVYLFVIFILLPESMSGKSLLAHWLAVIIVGSDWMLTLAQPQGSFFPFPSVLNVSWTLAAELTFYLLAPWLFRSIGACVAVFLFSLILRLSFESYYGYSLWTYTFFPSTIMFFLLGHFVRLLYEKIQTPLWAALGILTLSLCCSSKSVDAGEWISGYFYLAFTLFALSVPALFEATKNIRWMNRLGDVSFPIYLLHNIVILFLIPKAWTDLLISMNVAPIIIVLGFALLMTGVGFFVYYLVELPAARTMNYLLDRSSVLLKWMKVCGIRLLVKNTA